MTPFGSLAIVVCKQYVVIFYSFISFVLFIQSLVYRPLYFTVIMQTRPDIVLTSSRQDGRFLEALKALGCTYILNDIMILLYGFLPITVSNDHCYQSIIEYRSICQKSDSCDDLLAYYIIHFKHCEKTA